jgi:hypothetical protein
MWRAVVLQGHRRPELTSGLLALAAACSVLSPTDEELLGGSSAGAIGQAGSDAARGGADGPSAGGAANSGGAVAGGAASTGGTGNSALAGAPSDAGATAVPDPSNNISQTEAPIPREGLVLWLTSDHGMHEEDGLVAAWKDQSGAGHVALQSLLHARPKLVTVPSVNRKMLEFDGEDDSLALSEGFDDFSQGLSLFAIAVATGDDPCSSVLQLSNGPEQADIDLSRAVGAIHYEAGDEWIDGPAKSFPADQVLMLGAVHDALPQAVARINGVYMVSAAMPLPEPTRRESNFIGLSLYNGCSPFKGRIGEILLYDFAMTPEQRGKVEDYLQSKWRYDPVINPKPIPDDVATR